MMYDVIGLIYYIESFHDKRSHKKVSRKFHEKIKSRSVACRNFSWKKLCRNFFQKSHQKS